MVHTCRHHYINSDNCKNSLKNDKHSNACQNFGCYIILAVCPEHTSLYLIHFTLEVVLTSITIFVLIVAIAILLAILRSSVFFHLFISVNFGCSSDCSFQCCHCLIGLFWYYCYLCSLNLVLWCFDEWIQLYQLLLEWLN